MKRQKQNTHFTLETRTIIEEELNLGTSITNIAKLLSRDRSNIGREIERHKELKIPTSYNTNCCCINKIECPKIHYNCHEDCLDFIPEICDKLKSSPHVCNGCTTKNGCRKAKYYYNAKEANLQYQQKLVNSRKKMHYTQLEINILNNDFYCLVIQTRSIYHSLIVINSMGFNFNRKTIYRQIRQGLLRLKLSDLPRANIKYTKKEIDKSYKRDITGHTYEDYSEHKKNNSDAIEWQMDCVQGIQGKNEPVFLTLQIVKIKFIFIFIIDRQTSEKVIEKLKEFRGMFKPNEFEKVFEILLTDNGHEFIKLTELIEALSTENIYYCHPYSSCEKGSIENNHELIRRVIPQGVSLKSYTQDEINTLCSNINSLYREELDGKCPFDLVEEYIPKEVLKKLGYKKIEPKYVNLTPKLLGDKNIKNIQKYLSKDDIKKAHISVK